MNDHEISKLVNDLRDVAREYGQTQQLRDRIAGLVVPALKNRPAQGPFVTFDDGSHVFVDSWTGGAHDTGHFGGITLRFVAPDGTATVRGYQALDTLINDYQEVLADKRRLTRELDVLLNGGNAAQQASLCDIVAQVRREGITFATASARRLASLRDLCGFVENGTDGVVTIFQDDATREWVVKVGQKGYHGPTMIAALDAAIQGEGDKSNG